MILRLFATINADWEGRSGSGGLTGKFCYGQLLVTTKDLMKNPDKEEEETLDPKVIELLSTLFSDCSEGNLLCADDCPENLSDLAKIEYGVFTDHEVCLALNYAKRIIRINNNFNRQVCKDAEESLTPRMVIEQIENCLNIYSHLLPGSNKISFDILISQHTYITSMLLDYFDVDLSDFFGIFRVDMDTMTLKFESKSSLNGLQENFECGQWVIWDPRSLKHKDIRSMTKKHGDIPFCVVDASQADKKENLRLDNQHLLVEFPGKEPFSVDPVCVQRIW